MPNSRHQSSPDFRLMLSWTGIVGVLWLLLLWKSIGLYSQEFYSYPQSQTAVTSDTHVYATGDHQFSPRRMLNVLSSIPPPDHLIPIISALFFAALAIFTPKKTRIEFWLNAAPSAHQLQLATLNISRAPPFLY